MSQATRLGDLSSGHDLCSPKPLITGSSNVFINGKPSGRLSDIYESHGCDAHAPHEDVITKGSSTVFINSLPAARVNDDISIGGVVAEGSPNVRIGG